MTVRAITDGAAVDAATVYRRLCCGEMIIWLNEAAGEQVTRIRLAINEIILAGPRKQSQAQAARRILPWERAATLLFK